MNNDITMNRNEVMTFNNNEIGDIRTIFIKDEPWFVLKDVCLILDMKANSAGEIVKRLDEDEYDSIGLTDSLGRKQNAYVINESGLYNVIIRSDKPNAKPFRKWVTSEVLPSIRKTGGYIDPERITEYMTNEESVVYPYIKSMITSMELLQNQVADLQSQLHTVVDTQSKLITIHQPDTYNQNIWKKYNATPKINELAELLHIEAGKVYNVVYEHMSNFFGYSVAVSIREYKNNYDISDEEQVSAITAISDSHTYRKQFTTSVNALIDNARFAQKLITPSDNNPISEEQHTSIHFTTEDRFDDIIVKMIDVLGYNPKCPAKLYSEIYGRITSRRGWKHILTRHHCKSKKDVIISSPKYKKKFVDVCNQLVSEN